MGFGVHLLGGSHLLRALGLDMERMLNRFESYGDRLGHLADSFEMCAGGLSPAALGRMLTAGLPGAMTLPPPFMGHCPCPGHYAQPRQYDFGASHPFASLPERMANRWAGKKLERFLQKNPFARQQLEMMLGGRIVPDGVNDGRLTVVPFPPGCFPAGGPHNHAAFSALGMLHEMGQAAQALGFAQGLAQGAGMMQSLMVGALSNVLGTGGGGGYTGYVPQLPAGFNPNAGAAPGGSLSSGSSGGVGGAGAGAGGGDPEIANLLNDPTLTVEDKVTLMLMMIMKRMDKEIEKQAEYINKIQQQGNKGGEGGKGGAGGAQGGGGKGGGSSPSIDVETMKLKRLIDKRGQMFDMLRQIIDKYNETAKNIIQSMSR